MEHFSDHDNASDGANCEKRKECGRSKDCEPPDPPFSCEEVLKCVKAALLDLLEESYDDILCRGKARSTVRNVRAEVKKLGFDCRYKFIVFVTVAEKMPHDVPVAIRHNMNFNSDGYVCFKHKTNKVIGYIQCFGIFCTSERK